MTPWQLAAARRTAKAASLTRRDATTTRHAPTTACHRTACWVRGQTGDLRNARVSASVRALFARLATGAASRAQGPSTRRGLARPTARAGAAASPAGPRGAPAPPRRGSASARARSRCRPGLLVGVAAAPCSRRARARATLRPETARLRPGRAGAHAMGAVVVSGSAGGSSRPARVAAQHALWPWQRLDPAEEPAPLPWIASWAPGRSGAAANGAGSCAAALCARRRRAASPARASSRSKGLVAPASAGTASFQRGASGALAL
mmetsp:Transcript_5718/g.16873  ORF Transcript_5718/g.16873 Transcript_5718/m.16873 type:complete len:263 (+) Transcript_5718:97-885(+)